MSPKVLLCGNVDKNIVWAQKEVEQELAAVAEVLPFTSKSRDEFFKDLQGKYSEVVAIYRHNDSANSIGVFNAELISKLPQSVKYICHNGAGYDQIDIKAATERGIQVSHTPGAVDDATATTAMFLILSSLRQYWRAEVNARNGKWKSGLKPASDPEGKTIGIVGMGGIGSVVAKRCIAFDMKVIYYNRKPIQPTPSFECEYVSSLEELLKRSDVVSLNLPLNKNTQSSFGKEQFAQMKDGAVLVNTARGGVVDQEALIDALKSGKLASAGLDVFPNEPEIDERLVAMDNITLLPHMGTETKDTQHKMEALTLRNIISAIKGQGLLNQVAEQK
jgi:lactate dehydrogenase-like 2-hydroxyacid dehydrogenase